MSLASFGGKDADRGEGLTVDAHNNVYLTGSFQDQISIGASTLASSCLNDLLAASFAPTGSVRWSMRLGGTGGDVGRNVGVDSNGRVYVTGYVSGVTNLGGTPITSTAMDTYLLRFDP